MAKSLLKNLEGQFECSVCMDTFEDPRVLSCLHFFCKRCLERVVTRRDHKSVIECPTCRKETEVPEGRVENLQVNFFLNKLMSEVAIHKNTETCKIHDNEPIKMYCETCEITICRDCTMIDHRKHKYQFVRDVYIKEKAAVNQLLEETKAKQTVLRDAVKGVVEMKSRVQKARVKVAQQINSSVDSLIQALETGRNKLLQQAEEIERGKLKGLQIQQEELELVLGSVTSGVEFNEKILRDGSEVEVLSMKKQMTDRLMELKTATQPLKPCTDDIISYDVKPKSPDEIVKRLGRVYDSRIDVEKCAVKIESKMNALKLRKEIKLTILINHQYGRPRSEARADDVSVEIKSPVKGVANHRIEATDIADGTYRACYTPRVPGVHRVCVRINGADIRCSPFEWNVKAGVDLEMTSLQMEAREVGVVYNTLINQTRDFCIVTRNSNGKQICEQGSLISVEIQEPNNLNRNVVPVQDCRNGRYTFSYKPHCTGNYRLTIKVNGDDIQGSPFTWGVEQWHLVGLFRGSSNLRFSQDNMTVECTGGFGEVVVGSCGFTAGCHSWKLKVVSGKLLFVGITDCDVLPAQQENTWFKVPHM